MDNETTDTDSFGVKVTKEFVIAAAGTAGVLTAYLGICYVRTTLRARKTRKAQKTQQEK